MNQESPPGVSGARSGVDAKKPPVLLSLVPITASIVAAVAINSVPAIRAFGFQDEAWIQAGWALYFFLLPLGVGLGVVGLLATSICFTIRHPGWHRAVAWGVGGLMLFCAAGGCLALGLMS